MEKKLKQDASNCIKVVLFGPESTGKTTLSQQLAEYYNTLFVPEFSRLYASYKKRESKVLSVEDVLPIAYGQMQLENKFVQYADTLLICDTDLLETKVYSDLYYSKKCDSILEKYAKENTYDLYFLTYIDTPWEADSIRDRPMDREAHFKAFKDALERFNKPFVILRGSKKERFSEAIQHIEELIESKT